MSKTSDANSTGRGPTAPSRRFAASATGFADRYRADAFFRTEANIIGMQGLLLAGLLAAIGFVVGLISHGVPGYLWGSDAETRLVLLVSVTVVLVTVASSVAITRLALMPLRYTQESQKRFIGNVAHELRTPLSIIKADAEVALMSPTIDPDTRATFTSVVQELDRISEVINNHLSLSLATRPEQNQFGHVDLAQVVAVAERQLSRLITHKNIMVEVRSHAQSAVWGNALALEHALSNIIKNAITHTPPDGRILISIEPATPGYIECSVTDSGPGMSSKNLAHIFEPYYRGDPSRVRSGSQSGLGMTIVSEIIKQHNGRVRVQSALGTGTTVTLLIPVSRTRPVESGTGISAEALRTRHAHGSAQRSLFGSEQSERISDKPLT